MMSIATSARPIVIILSVILFIAPAASASSESARNFGVVYAAQWTVYAITQRETIQDHGSWQNWLHYPTSPHFDRDNLENNVIRHSLSGASYYLFYRSRGYEEKRAFLWTIASSLAFEFTIETFTERPSYQDIFLTPTFGTALGMGMERLSDYFHSRGAWPFKIVGYVLNPFALLPGSKRAVSLSPVVGDGALKGVSLSMDF